MKADVTPFFDERTFTVTYVVADSASRACAVVDSVLDYDPKSGRTSTSNANKVLVFVRDNELEPKWILETHAHADHLTTSRYLRENLGGHCHINRGGMDVQPALGSLDVRAFLQASPLSTRSHPPFNLAVRQFTLRFRDVEDLLAERGLDASYETIRRWFLKFGSVIAANLRRTRPRSSDHWHLDEMVIVICGRRYWLWRTVDNEGEVLDFLVQSRRNTKAAKKLMKKLLKKQGFASSQS
jgi:hypothetical protein